MTAFGLDWEWDDRLHNGAGGWRVHEHHDETREHADFLSGLHDKDRGNDR